MATKPKIEVNRIVSYKFLIRFAVRGSGTFPTDMLRRDLCYPASSMDATKMGISGAVGVSRTVVLHSVRPEENREPMYERWATFGWEVVDLP